MTAYLRPLVLIIDDDPDFLEIAQLAISRKGYGTIIASDGRQGLEHFQAHNPDLVILDLAIAGMIGLDVLWWIRLASSCLVIILTGTDDVETFLRAMDLEVDDYFTKGVGIKELVDRVELILGRSDPPVHNPIGDR